MPVNNATPTATEKPKRKRVRKKKQKSQPAQSESVNESISKAADPGDAVIYPTPNIQQFKSGKLVVKLTAEHAKELLGWRMEPAESKWSSEDYLIKDQLGQKVKCYNNVTNRPLYMQSVQTLMQEILRGKWRFNGEPVIIGKTGKILNGQHCLIALVLAAQEWDAHPGKWINWQEEPTIDKLVVFGVDEDDETVNTMDTCKPRSLADVLYRCRYFQDLKPKDRKPVARICSYAVNTCWERMGAKFAFAPRQTHSEALEFLDKHPKLIDAVGHVTVENGAENSIGKFLSIGYAAGMMYLMGCSNTDPADYIRNPCEGSLDFSNWDKAEEFWTLVGGGAEEVKGLRIALSKLLKEEDGGSRKERIALVCKAWGQYVANGKVARIQLKYVEEDEVKQLAEEPTVGGIDLIEFSREEAQAE